MSVAFIWKITHYFSFRTPSSRISTWVQCRLVPGLTGPPSTFFWHRPSRYVRGSSLSTRGEFRTQILHCNQLCLGGLLRSIVWCICSPQDYLTQVDPTASLGLSCDSLHMYQLSQGVQRVIGGAEPQFSPYRCLSTGSARIVVTLKG